MSAEKSEMQQIHDDGIISALAVRLEAEQARLDELMTNPLIGSDRVAEQAKIVQILREEAKFRAALTGWASINPEDGGNGKGAGTGRGRRG